MREYAGIGPLDEYPIHQSPRPVAWPESSDRNFYDRCYLNAHDRTGDLFLITGYGVYPNLGTKDAYLLVRRGDVQTALHFGDALDPRGADRMEQQVGNYSIEVLEPLRRLRLVVEETEGIAVDLTWEGSFPPVQEQRHVMRQGSGTTLDAQRFAQVGTWAGTVLIDGEELEVTPDVWVGTRDRSWGIRPVGEAVPAGKPHDPPFDGMWWLYLPLRFDDFAVVIIIQETPEGYRTLNDCTRVWPDGRVEQLGWPRVQITYAPGTREPTGATVTCSTPAGETLVIEVTSELGVALHIGGGYGGDPDWNHGVWRGAGFTERVDYDLSDPAVNGRTMFGVIDHVGRAVLHGAGADGMQGWGLFEHAALGRHDPTGFTDWFDLAP
ncbi:hypothetical protein [Nocardioides limicola]|uniref:hypothetical protein n=1 Tax=Nocardioides limicola TaxID=2803368 RepID=UPI00193B5A7D|nr:hypothetical protein [Nocardioides sp. DJM-14]